MRINIDSTVPAITKGPSDVLPTGQLFKTKFLTLAYKLCRELPERLVIFVGSLIVTAKEGLFKVTDASIIILIVPSGIT